MRVGLGLHNVPQLQAAIAAGQTVAPAQFAAGYGPTAAEAQEVVSYLQGQGFGNVTVSANRQLVSASGSAAQAAAAFDTTLHAFIAERRRRLRQHHPGLRPGRARRHVVAVLGSTTYRPSSPTCTSARRPEPRPRPAR